MSEETNKEKVLISIRRDYLADIDALVGRGAAPNRSALIEKVVGSFIQDLRQQRANANTALGAFVGFLLLLIGAAAIAELLGGGLEKQEKTSNRNRSTISEKEFKVYDAVLKELFC